METQVVQPSEAKVEKVTSTVFDLDSMADVTLFKTIEFTPVTNTKDALERLGNDAAKFLQVINDGLRSHVRESAKSDPNIPWSQEDEEGNVTEFAGTPADTKAVNSLVLTLAKTIFGYTKDASADVKRGAKEKAFEMIRTTEQIKNGLKENAAA